MSKEWLLFRGIRKEVETMGKGVSSYTHSQAELDHYANQHNPNNDAYWDDRDNHANQCNPNNDEYWHSREDDED